VEAKKHIECKAKKKKLEKQEIQLISKANFSLLPRNSENYFSKSEVLIP